MTNRVVWAGRYAVFDEIASGGMASVYLACRLEAGEGPRVVAIKKMFESFAKRPEFVTMFLDEAHIAARIRHPNVVTTHEFLRIPDSLGIVMEFVLGVSLLDLSTIGQDRGRAAPLGVTLALVRGMLAGLHAAHETKDEHGALVGLVHRDVSPHNIIVGKDGLARVIDFGIAKAAGRLQVTEVGVMKGKFAYMAPEQIRAAVVDRRVDIYSAGIVLWEMVTGQPLFRGSADAELFSRRGQGTATVPPPGTLRDGVSTALDDVILKALSPAPKERYATAAEMAEALLGVAKPASTSEVSEWVHSLAGSRLRELEAKRNEVETAYAAGELVGLSPTLVSKQSPPAPPAAPAVEMDLELDLPGPQSAPSKSVGRPASSPVPPPPPKRAPSMADAASAFDDPFAEGPGDAMKLDVDMPMSQRMPLASMHSQGLDARFSRGSVHSAAPYVAPRGSRRRGGGGALVFLAVLLALGGAVYLLGPTYLKTLVLASAARRGLTLSVASVTPRSGGLTLSGVTLELPGVKEVVGRAQEVELDLDWQGNVHKATAQGFDLDVHGSVTDVSAHYAAWRKSARLPVTFEAKAGHLTWAGLLVPGLQAEGINVSVLAGATDDGSVSLEAPSLTFALPRGNIGPWRAQLGSTATETKLTVSLDRSKADGPPNIVVVSRPALGVVLSATIPRTKLVAVGVPGDFFVAGSDPEVDLALELQVLPAGDAVDGHATLALFGTSGSGAAPGAPLDLVLEGAVHGDPSVPLRIDPASLTVGKMKSKITGVVTPRPESLRIDIERPPSRSTTPPPPFVFDTAEWTGPKSAPAPKPATSASASPAPSTRPRR